MLVKRVAVGASTAASTSVPDKLESCDEGRQNEPDDQDPEHAADVGNRQRVGVLPRVVVTSITLTRAAVLLPPFLVQHLQYLVLL